MAGGSPGLPTIPQAQELSLKELDRAAVTHRAVPDGAQAEEEPERDTAIHDRQMLLLFRILELLRPEKDPQDH